MGRTLGVKWDQLSIHTMARKFAQHRDYPATTRRGGDVHRRIPIGAALWPRVIGSPLVPRGDPRESTPPRGEKAHGAHARGQMGPTLHSHHGTEVCATPRLPSYDAARWGRP